MTEKNIFVYKSFSLFFMQKLQPLLKKVTSLFPSNPPLKIEILSCPPFFEEFGRRFNLPPPKQKGGGAHYEDNLMLFTVMRGSSCFIINLILGISK